MDDCPFCGIVEGRVRALVLGRNDLVTAFMDIGPVAPGHVLVVPNGHFPSMAEAPDAVLAELAARARDLSLMLEGALGATGFNVLVANGASAQQSVFHLHFHVIPRHEGDGIDLWFDRKPARDGLQGVRAVYERLMAAGPPEALRL